MRNKFINLSIAAALLIAGVLTVTPPTLAAGATIDVSVTNPAVSVSADTVGGTGTSIGTIVMAETSPVSFHFGSGGTVTVNAPSGFQFDVTSQAQVMVTGSNTPADNINQLPTGTTVNATTTATVITFVVNPHETSEIVADTLTWTNIKIEPTAGRPLAAGVITLGGTSPFPTPDEAYSNTAPIAVSEVVGAPAAVYSTFSCNPTASIFAGSGISTCNIHVADQSGNPIPGASVNVSASGSDNNYNTDPALTDVNGNVTITVQSTLVQTENVSATVNSSLSLLPPVRVTFIPGAVNHITITGPASVNALSGATYTAQAFDANNNVVPGITFTWGVTSGTGSGTIDGNGNFTADTGGSVTINANYQGVTGTLPVNVNFLNQTITFPNPGTQTYGVVPITLGATSSSGLPVTYTVTSGPGNIAGNILTITGAGSVTVMASQGGNTVYNPAPNVQDTFTVNPLSITVTPDSGQSKVYGDTDPVLTYTFSPALIGSDTFTGSLHRHFGKNVGAYGITQGTLTAGANYALTIAPVNFTITARPITVTSTDNSKVYDGTTSAAAVPTLTSGTLAFTDSLNFTETYDTKDVGTNKTLTPSGAVSDGNSGNNYTVTLVNNTTGVITAQPITVTVTAGQSKIYGSTDPVFAYTASSLETGDSFSGSLSRTSGESVGIYPINQGTLTAGNNYDITFVPDNFTVNPLAVTVTANSQTKVYGTGDPALTYVVVPALIGSDSFTGQLVRDAGENVGTYNINQGTLALSSNYTLTYAGASFTITQAPASVTPNALGKVYGATDPTLTGALSGFLPADNITATYSRVAGEDVGTYAISATLTPTSVLGNYAINYNTAQFTISAATVTVTATASDKVYDGTTNATVNLTVTGAVGSDNLTATSTTANFVDKNVDTGKTVTVTGITLSGTNANDYTFNNTATTTANITQLPITVTAATDSKVYDGTPASAGVPTITSGALVGTDSFAPTQTFDNKNVGTNKTLTPAGVVSDGSSGNNYAVTFVPVITGTITAKPLTVTATGVNKVYDGTTNATVTLSDNRVSGDVLTDNYGNATFAASSVGTAIPVAVTGISVTGTDAGNYTFNTTAATTANITPLVITLTPNPQTKVYGTTDPTLTYTYNPNPISPDVFTGSLSRAPGETVGGYAITQGTLALTSNYAIDFVTANLTITKATPVISWSNPSDVVAGTVLDGTELDATTSVAGTFVYTPVAGTQLTLAGSHTLSTVFNPTDVIDYNSANANVSVNVSPAPISQLIVTANPNSLPTNQSSTVTVSGEDQYDNVVTNNSTSVVTVSADNGGAFSGSPNLTLSSGVATVGLTDTSAVLVHISAISGILAPGSTTVTFTPVDPNPASVISTVPASGATGIAITAPLFINFNKTLESTSITGANIQLMQQASTTDSALDTTVPVTLSLVSGDTQVELIPTSPLQYNTSYYFVVNGVVSSFGIPMTSAYTSQSSPFMTAATTPAPTVSNQYPAASATGVALNIQPFVDFSETMDVTTLTAANVYLVADSAPTVAIPATVVTGNGGTRAIIQPTSPLSPNTSYHIIVGTGVNNTSSVALAGQFTGGSFTTLVPVVPTVLDQYPVATATGVPISVQPYVDFSEAMNVATLTSGNVYLTSTGTPVSATVVVANGGTRAIIEPTSPLAADTTYNVVVTTGVTDASGDPLATQYTGGTFTTAPDTTVLAVTGTSLLQSFATPDGTFQDGWKWQLNVTAPTDETKLQMQFTDFTSGSNTIPANSNIEFYSPQSSDHNTPATAVVFNTANLDSSGFSLPLADLTGDLDAVTAGRQFQVVVEVSVPVGTPGGSYSDSYNIQTTP